LVNSVGATFSCNADSNAARASRKLRMKLDQRAKGELRTKHKSSNATSDDKAPLFSGAPIPESEQEEDAGIWNYLFSPKKKKPSDSPFASSKKSIPPKEHQNTSTRLEARKNKKNAEVKAKQANAHPTPNEAPGANEAPGVTQQLPAKLQEPSDAVQIEKLWDEGKVTKGKVRKTSKQIAVDPTRLREARLDGSAFLEKARSKRHELNEINRGNRPPPEDDPAPQK
jgi:hypothetical protein